MQKPTIDEILERLRELQADLETEIDQLLSEKQELFRYTLEKGKVRFEQGMKALQRHQRTSWWNYIRSAHLKHMLTAPIVYSVFIPLVLLDIMATLYQQVCFRVYGIPLVARREYVIIDRHHLAYLNFIEKFNCVYCGYGNGLIAYVREISARTEQYWCPIKHAQRTLDPHQLVNNFMDYGDADCYKDRLKKTREEIKDL